MANADLGNSGVSFFGSTFDGYFEDEAKILANLIQHRASGNSFVSFEPSDGIIGAGETVNVTVKYNSTGLQKVNIGT